MSSSNNSSIDNDNLFPIDDIAPHRFPYDNLHGIHHSPTSFDMISDTVAIGNWTSSYESFDVIFNFNFPANHAQEQHIHRYCINHNNKEKIIYTIGLYDTSYFNEALMRIFMNLLPHLAAHKGQRILFHCFAGISRSSTAAIIYFMMSTNLSFESIYNMIMEKRPRICPNPAFMKILHICEGKRRVITKT